jgi:hypothetical protein
MKLKVAQMEGGGGGGREAGLDGGGGGIAGDARRTVPEDSADAGAGAGAAVRDGTELETFSFA